ncbi:MAG: TldD/PmbA family protein [Candidatus Lernaella stagnicola]|nr:TldD/PmbA family protein [Candidatus Lernaella stagnicola]
MNFWKLDRREFLHTMAAAGALAGVGPGAARVALAGNVTFGGLPLDEELITKLLSKAMSRGGEFAEVFVEDGIGTNVSLDEDKIRSATVGHSRGVGIRVISGIKVGYAYSDDFSPAALLRTADAAAMIAAGKGSWKPRPLDARMAASLSPIKINIAQTPVKSKVDILNAMNAAARGVDKRVIQVMGRFIDTAKYKLIANTDGLLVEDHDVMARLSAYVIASDGEDRRTGFYGGGGRVGLEFYRDFDPEMVGRVAATSAVATLGAAEVEAGEQTVVLASGWSGILLHEAIGHGLEADFNRKGTSLYTGRIGQTVASEHCTVIDDATIPNGRGSFNVDDEGGRPQRKVLIEKGVLRGYMADRLNAKLMGTESTGSGRRESFRHFPMPRMSNTFLAPGPHTKEDVIASVDKGIYCKMFGGGQVDIANGQFVFEVSEAYKIEGGKVTAPLKGVTLVGIGPKALEQVTMVANDAELDPGIGTCGKNGQSVPVGVGLPHLRIDNMTVGGSKA